MPDSIFDIELTVDGHFYKGWVNPSDKVGEKGLPVSFHVVLNDVSFGYLSYNQDTWTINEERPAKLVEAVGKEIERNYEVRDSSE